jgi:GNAT superfamily N-acetyltransferase
MPNDPILVAPTDSELAAAIEAHLFAFFRAMAASLDGELEESGRLSRHLAIPYNPMFKGVWGTRLSPTEVDDAVAAEIAWFREREAPFFFWWTGPGTTPDDLGRRLAGHGLNTMEEQQTLAPGMRVATAGAPGMVASLDRIDRTAATTAPAGLAIAEVEDETDLDDFKRVLIAGFGIPDAIAHGWVEASRRAGIGRTPWRLYLGRLDGEPVATNLLFLGGGVAGLHATVTVPAARGRGIGAAITVRPLLDARAAGYRHAVLWSTEMAVPFYERLGFRDSGVRINRYLWRAT